MSSTDQTEDASRPPGSEDGVPVGAIPIYDADEELQQEGTWYAASPGAGSYVSAPDSWRPVPPPMLASSLDTNARFRPHLLQKEQPENELNRTPSALSASQALLHSQDSAAYGSLDRMSSDSALPDDTATTEPTPAAPPAVFAQRPPVDPSLRGRQPAFVQRPRPPTSIRSKLTKVMIHMRTIKEAPRELWLIFALKFLSSYSYFSLSLILTIFLTDEFGMSDISAGWAYGAYGFMSTLYGLGCGWLIDYLGVRASLIFGAVVGAIARTVFALTQSQQTAVIMLYTLLPFSEALGIPIMTIGIKRYTNARNRTFAFSLFYSMMNVAALCAGPGVDLARFSFSEGFTIQAYPFGVVKITALRLIILITAVSTGAMCFVIFTGMREVHVNERGNLEAFTPQRDSPWQHTKQVLREAAFWRLTLFTVLLIGVRMVFRHMDATLPKYLVRQFGPDSPFGLIYAINPFLIIMLVPMVGLMTRHVDSFSMILYGSFVSAASPFWICFKQTYLGVVLFMVTLSIGEAVYSPRVYEYTMQVSPQGSEGIYTSLSSAPLFSVQLIVGGMSGWLLTNFMSVDGPHYGGILWGIIGLTSMTSPILMCLFREYISPSSLRRERQDRDLAPDGSSNEYVADVDGGQDVVCTTARPPSGRYTAIRTSPSWDEDDFDDLGTEDKPSPAA